MTNKTRNMQHMFKIAAAGSLLILLSACSASTEKTKDGLNEKKAELQKLKTEQTTLNEKVKTLEQEIAKVDSNAGAKAKLVSAMALTAQNFTHYIDLRGKIDAENISYIAPRGQGGVVKHLYIKKGDFVSKGQLILKLDDAVMLQQLEQQKTQLAYLKNLYERRKNLWDQGIGSEVEYVTAKNNVENMERQIAIIKETWNTTNVYADVSGVADDVNIREGEFFQGATAAGPQIRIVNTNSMKAVVDVPENYLPRINKGTPVVIEVPDIHKKFNSRISLVSQLINANSRGFMAEAKIAADKNLKPNQLALVKIQDYAASNVIVIPLTTIQTDEKGKYVFIVVEEKGKKIARKKQVIAGEVYGDMIEIKAGLSAGDPLITEGYQGLYDGQLITTEIQ